MPGPCSVRGCNEHGMVHSRRWPGKYCTWHYAELIAPLVHERKQNAGWEAAEVDSRGRIVEVRAVGRQRGIESLLSEPFLERALEHHRGIEALLA